MINVGLVGFGLSGRYLQAPFFQLNPKFNLKTIVSSQTIPSHQFPSTKRVDNFDDLLADDSIQLISICSPSSTHYTYAKAALESGKHVLIEKPMTATFKEAEEIFQLAHKLNLQVFVFHNRRFDSDYLTVKSVIESGVLGDIHTFEAHFDRFKPSLNPKKWKEVPNPANGILYDLGSHLIDQCLGLFGNPETYEGEVFTQRQDSIIDDAFDLRLNYKKLRVKLSSSLLMKIPRPRFAIYGSQGSFIKNGIDVQEEHLVADFWPNRVGFGIESSENEGQLSYLEHEIEINSKIKTLPGYWANLFENIANVILNNDDKIITDEQVLKQLEIISKIKSLS